MNRTTNLKRFSFLKPSSFCYYDIVAEKLYQPDLGEYLTYGVQVTVPGYTDILHDVATCKETAEYIVERLNYYQVSPVHLYDVVTDMLP